MYTLLLLLSTAIGQAAEPAVHEVRICDKASRLLRPGGHIDPRIDPDAPIEIHEGEFRVIGTRFTHVPGGEAETLRAYDQVEQNGELVATSPRAVPIVRSGSELAIGELSGPEDDPTWDLIDRDLPGCWAWTPGRTLFVSADGATRRIWMSREEAVEVLRITPEELATAVPGPGIPAPRMRQPTAVVRINLAERPALRDPERPPRTPVFFPQLHAMRMVFGLASRCEPWVSGATLLSQQDGSVLLRCPVPDGEAAVQAMVDALPRGRARQVRNAWDLGQPMLGRFAVADDGGYWLGDDLDLIADARDASGKPVWTEGIDAPGIILQGPGETVRISAKDGLVLVDVQGEPDPARVADLVGTLVVLPRDNVLAPPVANTLAACTGGEPLACAPAAQALRQREGWDPEAREAARIGCEADQGVACAILGQMRLAGEGGPTSRNPGLDAMTRACDLDIPRACWQAAELLDAGGTFRPDETSRRKMATRACRMGVDDACEVAVQARLAEGVSPADPEVVSWTARGCTAGAQALCLTAATSALLAGDTAAAVPLLDGDFDDPAERFVAAVLRVQDCDTMACLAEAARSWDRLEGPPEWSWASLTERLSDTAEDQALARLLDAAAGIPGNADDDDAFYDALAALPAPSDAEDGMSEWSLDHDPPPPTPCFERYLDASLVAGRGRMWFIYRPPTMGDPAFVRDGEQRPDERYNAVFLCDDTLPEGVALPELLESTRLHALGIGGDLRGQGEELAGFVGDELYLASDLSRADLQALSGFGGRVLSLRGVESLTPATAKALARLSSQHPVQRTARRSSSLADQLELSSFALRLDSVGSLSAEEAKALVRYPGGALGLRGLERLDPGVAEALATFDGTELDLSGLQDLSAEDAIHLARTDVDHLYLDGLPTLAPDAARALASFSGITVSLAGVRTLDIDTARALSQDLASRKVILDGLESLTPELASELASLDATDLSLNGLERLDGPTADALVQQDQPSLGGLRHVDVEAAQILGSHSGFELELPALELDVEVARALAGARHDTLVLGGGQTLTADVARALCAYTGDLELRTVTTLDLPTARVLGTCHARRLALPALRDLPPEIARALTRFREGDLYLNRSVEFSPETREALRQARCDVFR